jgi:hypothetical protein
MGWDAARLPSLWCLVSDRNRGTRTPHCCHKGRRPAKKYNDYSPLARPWSRNDSVYGLVVSRYSQQKVAAGAGYMLSSALKSFSKSVKDNERSGVVLGFLRPIDTDRISRELRLKENAVARGKNNLPNTDDVHLDAIEQAIVQRIESEWVYQGGELTNNLRAYADRLLGYSILAEFEKLRLAATNALTRLRSTSVQVLADLGPLRDTYLDARTEYDQFRARHKINRPARDLSKRWTTAGLLIILIGVESILNGFFFAKGSEFGLVGGVGTAIGISGFNVAFAFGLGLWPARWMHHRNVVLKFIAFLLVCAGLACIVGLHAFAAHLRDATALVGEDRAFSIALKSLVTAPWQLADLSSYYLFGLGLIFGLSAFWKGHSFDDPYPAYGATSRRMVAAREAYSDEHALLFGDLDEIKETTVEQLADGIDRIPLFPHHAARLRVERDALIEQFRAYEKSVQTAANQLLQLYRDENRIVRTTAPPMHFDQRWALSHSFLDNEKVNVLIAEAPLPTVSVEECLRELRELWTNLLTEYESLIARYPHPAEMA